MHVYFVNIKKKVYLDSFIDWIILSIYPLLIDGIVFMLSM